MSLSLVIVAFVVLLTPGGGVQAVFAPVDGDALKAAVGVCLGETSNGSCPIFAASNDATGNPYGVMGDWDVSQVTNFDSSTPNLYLFVLFVPLACGSLTILSFFFSCSGSTSTALTYTPTAFNSAAAFNADISKWDTAQVTTMAGSTSNFHLFVFLFNCLFHEFVVL